MKCIDICWNGINSENMAVPLVPAKTRIGINERECMANLPHKDIYSEISISNLRFIFKISLSDLFILIVTEIKKERN